MNAYDYYLEHSRHLEKDFLLGQKPLSYMALDAQCEKLAGFLQQTVGMNRNILLLAPNSTFFIVVYLAVLRSGNIVVPLSPETEQENLDFIREKCTAEMVFTTRQISVRLDFKVARVYTDDFFALPAYLNCNAFSKPITQPDQLAEIIFTSGSTGEPKGVMISHRNLIANTGSIVEYLNLTPADTMLVVLPFYYCYGLSLLHTHLRAGGSIVLNNMFMMLGGVINDLERYHCTGFAGVPSHFQVLLRKSESFKTSRFTSLRYVTQAGGKLHNAFIEEFMNAMPDIRFFVMYGQTEATARLAWLPPERLPEKIGSCGIAIPGVTLKVADDKGMPVKSGQTGEILAKGDNIMQGYYKDELATAETLHNGWLRTGDLGTVDKDGFIYLSARKKEIIKVGGRRISPKEIEEVIVSMPEVVDCTIQGITDEILGESMKATVILRGMQTNEDITADTIRAFCAERLAPYKIPQIIEIKDKISLTATGKKIKNQAS